MGKVIKMVVSLILDKAMCEVVFFKNIVNKQDGDYTIRIYKNNKLWVRIKNVSIADVEAVTNSTDRFQDTGLLAPFIDLEVKH